MVQESGYHHLKLDGVWPDMGREEESFQPEISILHEITDK